MDRNFKTLKELRDVTGQEQHSVLLDYDTFVNVKMSDKSDPQRVHGAEHFDFRFKPGLRGCGSWRCIAEHHDLTSRGPALGAYELDRPMPRYGPR